jgi:hypothetical protein
MPELYFISNKEKRYNEQEMIWKEETMSNLRYYSRICHDRVRETVNNLGQDSQCPVET